MDILTAAVITACGTILAALIASIYSMGRVGEKVNNVGEKVNNVGEKVNNVGNIVNDVRNIGTDIKHNVSIIAERLTAEKKIQEYRYNNLNEAQKEIKNSVEKTFELLKDWERLVTENKELREKIITLEKENLKLKDMISLKDRSKSKEI